MRHSLWLILIVAFGCSDIIVPLPRLDMVSPEHDVADAVATDEVESSEDTGQVFDIFDSFDTPICKNDEDCQHLAKPCVVARCTNGICTTENAPKGTLCSTGENTDDCVSFECNGKGLCEKVISPDGTSCIPVNPSAGCGFYKCKDGQCEFAEPCQDLDPCTKDECDDKSFTCRFVPISGEVCDDDDPCTSEDTCIMGICVGTKDACDDHNPCTVDSCSKEAGCAHVPADGLPCDDGNPCTVGDVCQNGNCMAGTPIDCDDGNICTKDLCDTETGQCLHEPLNGDFGECDANLCTVGDYCDGGFCHPGSVLYCPPPAGCGLSAQMNRSRDPNCDCIRSVCLPDLGCVYAVEDLCMECTFLPKHCDDKNPCTWDECYVSDAPDACHYVPLEFRSEESSCPLVDKCAIGGTCWNGMCVPAGYKDCDDKNPCTDDFCDKVTGNCVHLFNTLACDDKNPCTFDDRCTMGVCKGEPVDCDDKNPCTEDHCDTITGRCTFEPGEGFCDDGNPCTVGDRCVEGVCVGTKASCDDKDPCTIDYCDPNLQTCVNQPILLCRKCTRNEDCFDGNDCTLDICSDGVCKFLKQNGGTCDDGDSCTGDDRCVNGECVGGALRVCEERPCNVVYCDPSHGCVYVPVGGACDDGNPLTVGDRCVNGVCVPGAVSNCSSMPEGSTCTDGDDTTTQDFCLAGKCVGIKETNFKVFNHPTYFKGVSASRLIAGNYTDDKGASKGFLAEVPAPFSTPKVIAETVTEGQYNAVYGLLGAGDNALVAYAHDSASKWQVGGQMNMPKSMGDISAVDGAFNPLASPETCSSVYHYVFGGTTFDRQQVALIHCKAYSWMFGYLCLPQVSCGSFLTFTLPFQNFSVLTKDVQVLPYSGCSYSACIAEAYVGATVTMGSFVSSVLLKATPPVSGGDMVATLTQASNYFNGEVEAIKVVNDGSNLVLFGVGRSGLMFEIPLKEMSPMTDPTLFNAVVRDQSSYDFMSIASGSDYLFIGGVQRKDSDTKQWVIIFHRLSSGLGEFGTYSVIPLATCKVSTQHCDSFELFKVAYDDKNGELLMVGSKPTSDGYEGVLYRLDMKKITTSRQ